MSRKLNNGHSVELQHKMDSRHPSPPIQDQDQERSQKRDFFRLLQLFPLLHPTAILRIFIRCNNDFVRTIDNILYLKRYEHFIRNCKQSNAQQNDNPYIPNSNGSVIINGSTQQEQQSIYSATNSPELNNSCSPQTYIPNGTFEGIKQQLQNTWDLPNYDFDEITHSNHSFQNNCFGNTVPVIVNSNGGSFNEYRTIL